MHENNSIRAGQGEVEVRYCKDLTVYISGMSLEGRLE